MRLVSILCITGLLAFDAVSANVADPVLIVLDDAPIGEFKNGRWRDFDEKMPTPGALKFRKVGIGTVGGTVTASLTSLKDLGPPVNVDPPIDGVAVSGLRPSVPRPVKSIPVTSRHRNALAAHLKSQKVKYSHLRITKVYAADLDGDGSVENLIQAGSRPNIGEKEEARRPTDYSVVLVLPASGTRTHPMYDPKYYGRYEVVAVADFEGDRRMEVVVRQTIYEGMGAVLYRYNKGRSTALAKGGWML